MNPSPVTKSDVPPRADFQKTTILIVEDNPDHLFLIKSTLHDCMPGVNAVGLESGEEALEYMMKLKSGQRHQFPKLILSDLYLPDRETGLRALRAIRAHFDPPKVPPIPIVMFSYSNLDSDIKDCYGFGANAYMIKSSDYQEWADYFVNLREFWLETVSLPQRG